MGGERRGGGGREERRGRGESTGLDLQEVVEGRREEGGVVER